MGTGLSASILAMTALARFSVNFPRALQPDDRYRIERIRARPLLTRLYLFPWVAREVGLLTALALVLAAVAGVTEQLLGIIPWLFAITLDWSAQYVRLGYRLSEGDNRQRALWVVEGFILAPIVLMFGLVLMIVGLIFFSDVDGEVLWTLSPELAALVFVACLAIGIFGFGALDPALAIRRTVIYGALGIMAVFLIRHYRRIDCWADCDAFGLAWNARLGHRSGRRRYRIYRSTQRVHKDCQAVCPGGFVGVSDGVLLNQAAMALRQASA